ncbi:AcrR family transcriptional regulator [Hamadaea flava]|uniref:TetR/AcrR family transcriptional regulator n=1 Tax=Hamadaea flava TaxID=1742688 RepID=A0ABV8LYA6_9ACTN|nr:TetR/AcrR family transcriptional regulator [Hamadaea flava]MCP2327388.1 AcrR family transcriptional regulator [Hamadaea flava]
MTTSKRPPAGAAVLRPEITAAVTAALLQELSEVGFGRLSIERVARRAGVTKSAVYRRWDSKLDMVLELVTSALEQNIALPDTGTLHGDVRLVVTLVGRALTHPLAAKIVPDLLAEAARNPRVHQTLHDVIRSYQHKTSDLLVNRAIARGELPTGTDPDLVTDLLVGPVYWRTAVMRGSGEPAYLDQLASAIISAVAPGH